MAASGSDVRRATPRAARRATAQATRRWGGRAGAVATPAVVRLIVSAMVTLLALPAMAGPARAATYTPISGAGSTWSANALQQWIVNVNQYGIKVNFAATGSSDGRNQFRNGTVDFGVSEIPYGMKDAGVVENPPTRKFAYMPIVAGGTAFMYNLKIGGKRVTNLRLSGQTIARIFTGQITSWNDPAVRADNPGLSLPARKVVPVVRSDGSGTTAQLTLWLSKTYPAVWDAYCAKANRPTPCGPTSAFPISSGNPFTALSGSLGVAGYVSQSGSEGAITYVEYSYARNLKFPVAKVLNAANFYVEPTADAVAVALTGAKINEDPASSSYLTQILDGVYANPDRRSYPLSSYSYMIIPTALEGSFNANKGYTLGAFAYYFLCQGQQQAPLLGYSPLPINLVTAGFNQIKRIPGVQPENIVVKNCNNPTFSADGGNTLAKTAPYPPACDKLGAPQCATGTGGAKQSTVTGGGGTSSAGSGAGGATVAAAGAPGAAGAGAGAPGAAPPGAAAAVGVDPDTGQVLAQGAAPGSAESVSGQAVLLASSAGDPGLQSVLVWLSCLVLLGVVVGPPAISRLLSRGRQ